MNPHEVVARADKAWKLYRWISKRGYRLDRVGGWDDEQWRIAAVGAGVHEPSEVTRGVVLGMMMGQTRKDGHAR